MKKKVLFLDDERLTLKYVPRMMPDLAIIEAESGQEGLEKFRQQEFDAIVSDLFLGDLNGLEFAKKIRESDSDIQIYIYSGYLTKETSDAIKSGLISGAFEKPVDYSQLQATILDNLK